MSSFVVSKREFIKAAGLMCGYEESKRHSHRYFIDHVREEFEHAYALNVVSVYEQYGSCEEPEEESYDDVFVRYRKMGTLIGMGGYEMGCVLCRKVADVMDKQTFRKSMFRFFTSVLYQIENKTCHRSVSSWFFTCLCKLYDDDLRDIEGWWGEIELAA